MTNSEFPLFDRRPKRKLAAILAADVVGFSKMMGENEDRTWSNLKACREITDGAIREHHGRVLGQRETRSLLNLQALLTQSLQQLSFKEICVIAT